MEFIKELIFGNSSVPTRNIIVGTHTIIPENQPSFEDWCREFRVSSLYDRKAIYFN